MRLAVALAAALAVLAGCTSVTIDKRADGSYKAELSRVWSDVTVTIDTPDGGALTYSSDADTASTNSLNRLLLEALLPRTGAP